jgi:hypothetical protein
MNPSHIKTSIMTMSLNLLFVIQYSIIVLLSRPAQRSGKQAQMPGLHDSLLCPYMQLYLQN